MSVTGGAGSNGHTAASDPKGIGGSATGIALSGTAGADITGAIHLNLVAGTDGTGTTPTTPKTKTLTAIDNQMTTATGILTFESGSSLAVGAAGSGVFGINNQTSDVIYNFGSGEAKTVFEAVGDKTANTANNDQKGNDAIGLNLVNSATIKGNIEFSKIQGQDGETKPTGGSNKGGEGGSVYGIKFAAGQSLTLDNANVVFKNLVAGEGGASDAKGDNGKNIGIDIAASSTSTFSGSGKIVFEGFNTSDTPQGGARTVSTENIVINNGGTKLTLSGVSIDAKDSTVITDENYAIYNGIEDATYKFGTETVLENYSQGVILVADSILKGNLNITTNDTEQGNVAGLVIRGGTHDTNGNATTADVNNNSYAIFAGIDGAQFNFGNSTTFAAIVDNTATKNDAAGIYLAKSNATFSGNATFNAFIAKKATDKGSGASAPGDPGGSAYGIEAKHDGAVLTFKDANISFAGIKGGQGGAGDGDNNAGGKGGDAAGIYVNQNALTISGSGTLTLASVEGGDAAAAGSNDAAVGSKGDAYIIQNASNNKTLTLGGVSVIAGSKTGAPTAGTYGIYSNLAGANYAFGELNTGGTILNNGTAGENSAGTNFAGMIAASNVYANGVLKVTGQDANGQVVQTAPVGRAVGDGLKGGDVVGMELLQSMSLVELVEQVEQKVMPMVFTLTIL